MKVMMIRYPHGWFSGGLTETDYSPAVTTSSWECNNYLLEVYQKEDTYDKGLIDN